MPAEASVAVRTLFAPFDASTEEFLAFVNSARHSIYVTIYGFHLPPLTDALIAKHKAGVKVNVILDHSQAAGKAEAGEVQRLVDAGVPLLIGTSPVHHQILHTKATIVDERAVESGSWNYSLSASQQSNTLTFVSDPDYARAYLDHWHRLRGFILLHEMVYQPKGEVTPDDVPAVDVLPDTSPASSPDTSPVSASVTTSALPPAPAASPSSLVAGNTPSASVVSMQAGGAPRPRVRPRVAKAAAQAAPVAQPRRARRATL